MFPDLLYPGEPIPPGYQFLLDSADDQNLEQMHSTFAGDVTHHTQLPLIETNQTLARTRLGPPALGEGIPLIPPTNMVDLVSDSENSVGHQKDSKPRQTRPTSPPDSAWELDCRCGVSGNGNQGYDPDISGKTIQCNNCRCWSHIACQRNERASHLGANSIFICDDCDETEVRVRLGEKRAKARKSERKHIEERTGLGKPLKDRLWTGRGALARHGKYWYPVRLILRKEDGWVVQWWRGNDYKTPGIERSQTSTVSHENLRDSMWLDRDGRRAIRLGKWTRSDQTDDLEDVLLDPSLFSFTEEDDAKLSPFIHTLKALLNNNIDDVENEYIPAKEWFDGQPSVKRVNLVPYSGSLSVPERGRIMNWFEIKVSDGDTSRAVRDRWMGSQVPLAHAYTLFILAGVNREHLVLARRERERREAQERRLKAEKEAEKRGETVKTSTFSKDDSDALDKELQELLKGPYKLSAAAANITKTDVPPPSAEQLEKEAKWEFSPEDYLEEAWNQQINNPRKQACDVAKESLQRLEEEMFENSLRAGIAGNEQWGLDIGPVQRGFHPYLDLPAYMNDGKRVGDEYDDEIRLGPNYRDDCSDEENATPMVKKERPKPKAIRKRSKK